MISDVVDLMQFPMVSTGENYGVIRTFQPFVNKELETARFHNMEHARFVFLNGFIPHSFLLHRISAKQTYTVTLNVFQLSPSCTALSLEGSQTLLYCTELQPQ